MIPKTIHLVPKISIAALQAKLDKQLAMWYCLRAINYWGSGRLDMEYATKYLTTSFGYSRSAAYRILNAGDGIFWDKKPLQKINRLQIKIYGLQKVVKSFHIHCGRRFRNRADLNDYLEKPNGLTEDSEELNAKDKAAEEAMLRLRLLVEGIEVSQLTARFGQDNIEALIGRFEYMVSQGRLLTDGSRYRLPSSRVLTSNPIFAEVIEAGSPE